MNDKSSCVIVYTVHSVYHNYVLETLCLTFLHCCTFTPNTQPSLRTVLPPAAPHMIISSGLAGLLSLSWRLTAEWSHRPLGQGWLGPPLASTLVHSCMHGRTHATMIVKHNCTLCNTILSLQYTLCMCSEHTQ